MIGLFDNLNIKPVIVSKQTRIEGEGVGVFPSFAN